MSGGRGVVLEEAARIQTSRGSHRRNLGAVKLLLRLEGVGFIAPTASRAPAGERTREGGGIALEGVDGPSVSTVTMLASSLDC